jgi:hypothetical protein
MTTALNHPLSQTRTEQLIREAHDRRLALRPPFEPLWSPLVIRLATAADQPALERLAELDSRPTPVGTTLIAELRGNPVAAVSLGDGEQIADPFVPTSGITELLRLRARQLSRQVRPQGWFAQLRHGF